MDFFLNFFNFKFSEFVLIREFDDKVPNCVVEHKCVDIIRA